jgi:beta-lactamase regulating signal transducer with metallopeptidase domain
MIRISEILLNFAVNAAWQIALIFVIAGVGSQLLRNAPAKLRHALWLVVLTLSLIVPLWTITGFTAGVTSFSKPTLTVSEDLNSGQSSKAPASDTGVDRLLTRRKQIVNARPRGFILLSIMLMLFVFLRVIRLLRLWWKKESLRRNARPIPLNPVVEAAAARCSRVFDVGNVSLRSSDQTRLPVTLGTRRPVIILPEHFCRHMDEETLVSVIGHEAAHVSRRDFATNFICELVTLPISFHPLTYLVKREIGRARELACDELVTERLLGRGAYARSLVRVANAMLPPADAFTLSILGGNILEQRITKLTKGGTTGIKPGRAIMVATIAALCVVGLTITNLSFDLRAYADASVASAFATSPFTLASKSETGRTPITRVDRRASSSSPMNGDQSAQERARAACDAAQRRAVDSIPTLIAMLGDESKSELIRCWEGSRWSPALETFNHPSPGEQAALALASMGSPAFAPLAEQLSTSNAVVRRNAAWAIGELTGMLPGARAAAVPQLIDLLSDSDVWARVAAARALGELRDDRATEQLVITLSDADAKVREMSAWALSEMKDHRAVEALCRVLLTDPQPAVRRTAAEALGEIRSAAALASLKQALNDPEARVRAKAGWAISEIGDTGG